MSILYKNWKTSIGKLSHFSATSKLTRNTRVFYKQVFVGRDATKALRLELLRGLSIGQSIRDLSIGQSIRDLSIGQFSPNHKAVYLELSFQYYNLFRQVTISDVVQCLWGKWWKNKIAIWWLNYVVLEPSSLE